jgi:GTP cyclohydrolase-4
MESRIDHMNLPSHQRSRRSFADTFERTHEQTIAAMDQGGHDIARQSPRTKLRVKCVGVKRRAIPILLADPFGGESTVHLSCSVDAMVGLGPDRRGIHTSRIGDLLAKLTGTVHASLQAYAAQLNGLVRASQGSDSAHVSVQGVFSYLENVRGVKEKRSVEHLELFADADFDHGGASMSAGIGFGHITACPCVQETYRHSFGPNGNSPTPAQKQSPLLTHSQRCRTRLMICGVSEPPTVSELLACVDEIVVRSQNTLPREFELLNVHRAHAQPQFLEDVLRDLLPGIHRLVRKRSAEGRILIKSASMESIHDFDLEGEIEYSLSELDQIFAPRSAPGIQPGKRSGNHGFNG